MDTIGSINDKEVISNWLPVRFSLFASISSDATFANIVSPSQASFFTKVTFLKITFFKLNFIPAFFLAEVSGEEAK